MCSEHLLPMSLKAPGNGNLQHGWVAWAGYHHPRGAPGALREDSSWMPVPCKDSGSWLFLALLLGVPRVGVQVHLTCQPCSRLRGQGKTSFPAQLPGLFTSWAPHFHTQSHALLAVITSPASVAVLFQPFPPPPSGPLLLALQCPGPTSPP